jgi:putative chitinase
MITFDQLRTIMPHAKNLAYFIDPLDETMHRFAINSTLRQAAFIANLAHESGEFRYMQEIADGSAYDNRADLGNTDPEAIRIAKANGTTPGRMWKGHGPIQITGFWNHRAVGEYLGIDAVHYPGMLCQPHYGCLSAGWFWHVNGINAFADKGDFDGCCDVINRGRKTAREGDSNGWQDRVKYYERAKAVL